MDSSTSAVSAVEGGKASIAKGGRDRILALDSRRSSALVPRHPCPKDMRVFETEEELRKLIAWLDRNGRREGPLLTALIRAFPEKRLGEERPAAGDAHADASSDASQRDHAAGSESNGSGKGANESGVDGGDGFERGDASAAQEVQHGSGVDGGLSPEDGRELGSLQGAGENEGPAAASTAVGSGEDAAAISSSAPGAGRPDRRRGARGGRGSDDRRAVLASSKRCQELPRLLQEGQVELRMATNPPGAHGNVMLPASEAVVEFDNEADAAEVKGGRG